MKTLEDITKKILELNTEAKKLNIEIEENYDYQKQALVRPTRNCDYVIGREQRIAVLEAKIKAFEWVIGAQ